MRVADPAVEDRYYQALLARAADHVGVFYVGVRTTGVFCIATCRARKPKRENVEFYTTFKAALDAGFRPCKVCRPTENAELAPPEVAAAIELAREHPKEKIGDARLRAAGIAPERVRRWFLRHYGMTFHAFQRMARVNQAVRELQSGRKASDCAMDAGYDSLSGFGYIYKKYLGATPRGSEGVRAILLARLTTPLGPMFACASEQGVCLLEFVDRRMLESEFEDLQRRLQAPILAGENEHLRALRRQLDEYFAGSRQRFELALHLPGTPFQQQAWQALLAIPCGSTASYQQQAEAIGRPHAARAVAAANGMNRVAIVVPCHRVVGKDGSLTGYGGGLERKRWLLAHEHGMGMGDAGGADRA
ncbi:XRE family transcriptional regulator [Xenophilus sp. AP218F]|nr:methylated-DNA--[protein]-cysteine S-methyltransferase [Chromobacterium sp. ASV5]OWY37207.1 XRE family transcriptional regulator [Xenophilus sp. AP218F]